MWINILCLFIGHQLHISTCLYKYIKQRKEHCRQYLGIAEVQPLSLTQITTRLMANCSIPIVTFKHKLVIFQFSVIQMDQFQHFLVMKQPQNLHQVVLEQQTLKLTLLNGVLLPFHSPCVSACFMHCCIYLLCSHSLT